MCLVSCFSLLEIYNMIPIRHPFTAARISRLRAGDSVAVSGLCHTGRDRFHKHLAETGESRVNLRDGAIFHCGPIVAADVSSAGGQNVRRHTIVAAGPTTSIREEPYMPRIIAEHGLRVIIGKGGMGAATTAACRDHGCVYLQAVGGAAALIARTVKRVVEVNYLEEFGATEAVWSLELDSLETICAIDTLGNNLHDEVREKSRQKLSDSFL